MRTEGGRSAQIAGAQPLVGSGVDPRRLAGGHSSRALVAVLWTAQAVLAGALAAAGAMKLATPLPELGKMFAWTAEVPPRVVTLVAVAELAAALAVVVPPWIRIAAMVSEMAAAAVAFAMAFATALHLARGEMTAFRTTVVIGGLAAFVAWVRSRAPSAAPVGRVLDAPPS